MAVQQQINKFIQGIGASPGIIIGTAYLLELFKFRLPQKQINPGQVEEEVNRFLNAIQESQDQLTEIKEKILDPQVRKHSFILDVHVMILNDEMLLQDTVDTIRKKKVNAEWGLDLTLQMNLEHVAGFITDIGGKVSHTAILSRSLGLPAVVGLEVATSLINGGDPLIIDGETGEVVINPTEEVSQSFIERKRRTKSIEREILKYASLPAETRDGVRVRLQANIEMVEEISSAKMHGAEGIGLYRTEILYLNRKDLLTEEDDFPTYRH